MTEEKSMVKTDCFGFRNGNCTVLYEMVCEERTCSFYKTCEQYHKDMKKYSYKGRGAS